MDLSRRFRQLFVVFLLSYAAVSVFFGGDIIRRAGEIIRTDMFNGLADDADLIKDRVDIVFNVIVKARKESEKKGTKLGRSLNLLKKADEEGVFEEGANIIGNEKQ